MGVVHEIQQDLFDGVTVRRDLGQVLVRKDEQLDIRRQHAPQHSGQIVQQVAQMNRLERQRRAAGKPQQLIHHQAAADRCRDDVAQARFIGSAGQQLGVGEDDRQQIVEVVRDPAGELADRFHLLRLAELFFQAAPLTDVFGEHLVTLDPAVLIADRAAVQTHRDRLAVLPPPDRLAFDGAHRLVHLREVAGPRRRLLEHVAVEMAAQELRLRFVRQHFDERGVHGEKRAFRRRAENAERGLLHERAAGGVGAPQRLLGPAPFRDIGRHTHDARDGAVPFADRRVLRLELEPEQLDARGHRLTGEGAANVGDRLRHVPEQLEERFAHQHSRPHAERVQPLSFGEREDTLRIEREKNDGRTGDHRAQPLLAGPEHLLVQDALGDVTRVDDHAVRIRLIEPRLTDRFEHAPRAVGVLEPECRGLRRPGLLNRVRQRFHDGRQIVGMHELEGVASQELVGAIAQQPLHRRAHVTNDAVIAQNCDDVGGVFGQ